MARQTKGRGTSTASAPGRATPRAVTAAAPHSTSAEERLAALEAERDALQQELTLAKAKIAALEAVQDDVANRIVWALDSLRSIVDRDDT
jgi:Domain of unknown function (DUF4164)